jgi:hypothetical protein
MIHIYVLAPLEKKSIENISVSFLSL